MAVTSDMASVKIHWLVVTLYSILMVVKPNRIMLPGFAIAAFEGRGCHQSKLKSRDHTTLEEAELGSCTGGFGCRICSVIQTKIPPRDRQ